jgi:hypothetical protein
MAATLSTVYFVRIIPSGKRKRVGRVCRLFTQNTNGLIRLKFCRLDNLAVLDNGKVERNSASRQNRAVALEVSDGAVLVAETLKALAFVGL